MYASRSESRFGYYGEGALPNLQIQSYVSSEHSSVESPTRLPESPKLNRAVDVGSVSDSKSESSPNRGTDSEHPSGDSSASTAPARHGTCEEESRPVQPPTPKCDESQSPFSHLLHTRRDDSSLSSSHLSKSFAQESLTMSHSQPSRLTDQYAQVVSLPSQSFHTDARSQTLQGSDFEDSDSDFELEEQSLNTATPPKPQSSESLSQHELSQSRVSSKFSTRLTNQSQASLPYDPKWEELASMQKALADIQERVANFPLTSPPSSDDSIQSSMQSFDRLLFNVLLSIVLLTTRIYACDVQMHKTILLLRQLW